MHKLLETVSITLLGIGTYLLLGTMHKIWRQWDLSEWYSMLSFLKEFLNKQVAETWRAVAMKMPSVPPQTHTSNSNLASVRRCLTLTTFAPLLAGCSFMA